MPAARYSLRTTSAGGALTALARGARPALRRRQPRPAPRRPLHLRRADPRRDRSARSARGCDPAETNLYEWSEGTLSPDQPGTTARHADAQLAARARRDLRRRLARLLHRRRRRPALPARSEAGRRSSSRAPSEAERSFQTASADGSLAFFTKGGHLYRYDADHRSRHRPDARRRSRRRPRRLRRRLPRLLRDRRRPLPLARRAPPPRSHRPAAARRRLPADHRHRPGQRRRHPACSSSPKPRSPATTTPTSDTGEPDSEVFLYDAGAATASPASPATRPASARSAPRRSPARSPTAPAPAPPRPTSPASSPPTAAALFFDSGDALVAPGHQQRAPTSMSGRPRARQLRQAAAGCLGLISSGRERRSLELRRRLRRRPRRLLPHRRLAGPERPRLGRPLRRPRRRRLPGARRRRSPARAMPASRCRPNPKTRRPAPCVAGPGNPPVHFPKAVTHRRHHAQEAPSPRAPPASRWPSARRSASETPGRHRGRRRGVRCALRCAPPSPRPASASCRAPKASTSHRRRRRGPTPRPAPTPTQLTTKVDFNLAPETAGRARRPLHRRRPARPANSKCRRA